MKEINNSNIYNHCRYPYDTKKTPAFQLTFFHQCFALWMAAYSHIAKDCLLTGLINSVTCQFELIKNSLAHITKEIDDYENSDSPNSEHSVDFENHLYEELKLCIIHHQKTLILAKDVESCFSFPTFVQFNVTLLIVCTTAIQLAMVSTYIYRN